MACASPQKPRPVALLEKAGRIESLELQPTFILRTGSTSGQLHQAVLAAAGEYPKIGEYRGDFKYFRCTAPTGWVVEDVKGMDTPLSKWKRKHVKAQYGIDVEIIK